MPFSYPPPSNVLLSRFATNSRRISVSCTAKPLLLYVLDQVLTHGVSATVNTKLGVFLEAMKVYKETYDYADLVLNTAHRISLEAQTLAQDQVILGWEDMLSRNPKAYLRFIATMDVAIAKGAFPKESDLPSALQPDNDPDRRARLNILYHGQESDVSAHEVSVAPSTGLCHDPASNLSSPHGVHHAALLIPHSENADGDVDEDETMACRHSEIVENGESMLFESEAVIQNLLVSYLHDSRLDAMDSLWPADIL
jgi:hypothetical protein